MVPVTPLASAQQAPAAAKAAAAPKAAPAAKPAKFDASGCFGCHAPIKEFHDSGKHKGLACTSCHSGIEKHLGNPQARPVTSTDPATCGGCHKNQFDTAYQMDWHRTGRFEKKQMTGPVAQSGVRPADDAARLHARAQPAALARLHGARPVRRRPRLRRPLHAQGQLALSGQARRQLQGLGRHPGQLPGQHRPEAVQAGHGRRGQSGVHFLQDAGPHPRLGLHGRSGTGCEVEPLVEGGRDGARRSTTPTTASSATTRMRPSRASCATP